MNDVTRVLCEAFENVDYIVVNVYENGIYAGKERINKSYFEDKNFYTGRIINIKEL